MPSNTLYLVACALVAGLIGTSVWAYHDQPGMELPMQRHGLLIAER